MSNVAFIGPGRSGALTKGRLGKWMYQTGHWGESAFINTPTRAAFGECLVPRSVSYQYNGFSAPVDFYRASKVTADYKMIAYEIPGPPTNGYRIQITWRNHSPPMIYNFSGIAGTDLNMPQSSAYIHPSNLWGATGAALNDGWMPTRGQWLFDVVINFNGAMLNPFNTTPRTASLMCRAHRYYSLGLNRDQVLHTWTIGLGGPTSTTFRKWLHVDPLWFMWVNIGAEYSTELADGTELITMFVNATRLSPPAGSV